MRQRFIVLLMLLGSMTLVIHTDFLSSRDGVSPTLVLGFLLLAAYCIAFFLEYAKLPRITGFIAAGLLLGPYMLNIIDQTAIQELSFLNTLALAFIAFSAGGELKISNVRHQLKNLLYLLFGVTAVVFIGVSAVVYLLSDWIPFMADYHSLERIAIASIFGIIAVARSPSSAIAVISETKAKGAYTDTVLSVTIVTDVLIIILFGIIISFSQAVISGEAVHAGFLAGLLVEIGVSFVIGFVLGKAFIYLIETIGVSFPIVMTGIGFIVIKLSHLLSGYLQESHQVGLHLEPLLICMAAGFTVQNFSRHGTTFLLRMDRISVPIYIAFFTITGASLNLDILKSGWILGVVIVIVRVFMLFIGSWTSGRLSGDTPLHCRYTWLACNYSPLSG